MPDYVLSAEDRRRVERSVQQTERHIDRDRLRKRNKSGGGTNKVYARIVQTLRRADQSVTPAVTAIDYYEIELLEYPIEQWSATHGVYYVGDRVKYPVDSVAKIFEVKEGREHVSSLSRSPTNTTYWQETTYKKALVFGYSGNLLAAAPWFQPNDIVEVVNYKDSRPEFSDREWWILETVTKIEEGEGADKIASLYWLQEQDGEVIGRLCSVYR
jgi:hypothetical protein